MININNNLIQGKVLQASILDSTLTINGIIFIIALFIIVLLFLYNISPYFYKNFILKDLDSLEKINTKYLSDFKPKEKFFNKSLNNIIHNYANKQY